MCAIKLNAADDQEAKINSINQHVECNYRGRRLQSVVCKSLFLQIFDKNLKKIY
jgi:hypothetical protein